MSGGRTSQNFFILAIKDITKTLTLKQPPGAGGATIVSGLGNSGTHCYWTGTLWILQ